MAVMIYVNKIEKTIIFKIKTENYLELLTPEMMKLLESTVSNVTKDGRGENIPHLEMTEGVLIHCNIINDYQQDPRILYIFVPNKSVG